MRWIVSIVIGLLIWVVVAVAIAASMDFAAKPPGSLETSVITRIKHWRIGGKDARPVAAPNPDVAKEGAEHFQHHCQGCHGLDGQNTGVPIATRMSPVIADLASPSVQQYTDGQLKWIIDNGIRLSGMPGWKGIVSDDEEWAMVYYIRHLPQKGSMGMPKAFEEEKEEHEASSGEQKPAPEKHHRH
jgi:mono/diheme cytochrome c family protein